MSTSTAISVTLPRDLDEFVRSKVASGDYDSAIEVIREGLRLLAEHEALLETPASELRARIAVGLEQAERGELLDGEEVFRKLEARLDSAAGTL